MTLDEPPVTPEPAPRPPARVPWWLVVAVLLAVAAAVVVPRLGRAPAAREETPTESAIAAWQRMRSAFLAAPPPRIVCDVLEQDGATSRATVAVVAVAGEGAVVTKRDEGAGGLEVEATFSARSVTYSADAPKDVALAEPVARAILAAWFDYGAGGVLAATFADRARVESRLRDPSSALGPFVPQRVKPDPEGRGVVVEGVIVSARRRLDVAVTFGEDGRPRRRALRDPTPPRLPSSLERYAYP